MANTVNVTTANTFEEWRVKTNEVGTAIGDLDEITVNDIGATTIVAAVKAHQGIVAGSLADTGGTMTGDLNFGDNVDANFGTGTDLKITHDGTNTSLTNITGQFRLGGNDLRLQTQNHSEDYILCVDGGAVTLHYNDNAKIATTDTGVDVTGVITADGLDVDDDHIIKIGTGDDLQLSHDGTDSIIDSNTGILKIQSDDARILNAAADETLIKAVNGGAVELYYDNSKKFETTTAGGTLTGALTVGAVTASGQVTTPSSGLTGSNAGLRAATLLTLGTGTTTTMTINSGNMVGIGTTPHATYKVDVNGTLNATTLRYGGSDIYDNATFSEAIADTVGAMVGSNTESGISVTYDDTDNTLDFNVVDPTITLTGAVTGSATMTNLGSVTISTSSGAGNIITDDIADLAVTTAKIANDAVSRAKLKDEVELIIYNSAGTAVKTLYGAGS